jgi:ElaB/YqjD/DUF883 family membrane-anchored ribosome-binding protein
MNKHTNGIQESMENLAGDARALLAATTDIAGEKMMATRERLADALDSAKDAYAQVQKKAIQGAKAADKVVRSHPYQTIGIAFGVGALAGFLWSRRK